MQFCYFNSRRRNRWNRSNTSSDTSAWFQGLEEASTQLLPAAGCVQGARPSAPGFSIYVILVSGSLCTSGEQYQPSSTLVSQNGHLPHLWAGRCSVVRGGCSSAGSVVILRFHPLCNGLFKDGRLLLKHPVAPLCQKNKPTPSTSPHTTKYLGSLTPDPLQFFRIPRQHGTQIGHHSSCGFTCSNQSLTCRPLFLM